MSRYLNTLVQRAAGRGAWAALAPVQAPVIVWPWRATVAAPLPAAPPAGQAPSTPAVAMTPSPGESLVAAEPVPAPSPLPPQAGPGRLVSPHAPAPSTAAEVPPTAAPGETPPVSVEARPRSMSLSVGFPAAPQRPSAAPGAAAHSPAAEEFLPVSDAGSATRPETAGAAPRPVPPPRPAPSLTGVPPPPREQAVRGGTAPAVGSTLDDGIAASTAPEKKTDPRGTNAAPRPVVASPVPPVTLPPAARVALLPPAAARGAGRAAPDAAAAMTPPPAAPPPQEPPIPRRRGQAGKLLGVRPAVPARPAVVSWAAFSGAADRWQGGKGEEQSTVQVHIGRVEVRAAPPSPQSAPPAPAPAPVRGFDDYFYLRSYVNKS